ncbi:MAG: tripartite tricarboxylate transporter TctB family protein, partial [Thermodesulfobacteriota bacterium]|nr:tripartite tricarboxylate transporter TctB family protein [Thermodesulfobacteriota bacterium]
MKRAWQIMCMAFVALSVFTLVLSFEYPYKDRLGPGPAFFPVWMSIITGALSLALFFQTTWGKSVVAVTATLIPERQGVWRIMIILVALLGCLALLDPLGFRISLFLFLIFLPLGLGGGNWWVTLIFAVAGSFGIFHVFYYWLKVPLPMGMFGI